MVSFHLRHVVPHNVADGLCQDLSWCESTNHASYHIASMKQECMAYSSASSLPTLHCWLKQQRCPGSTWYHGVIPYAALMAVHCWSYHQVHIQDDIHHSSAMMETKLRWYWNTGICAKTDKRKNLKKYRAEWLGFWSSKQAASLHCMNAARSKDTRTDRTLGSLGQLQHATFVVTSDVVKW